MAFEVVSQSGSLKNRKPTTHNGIQTGPIDEGGHSFFTSGYRSMSHDAVCQTEHDLIAFDRSYAMAKERKKKLFWFRNIRVFRSCS